MEKAIQRAIEGGYTIEGKLDNKGLGYGKWTYDEQLQTIDIRRNEVEIDYASQFLYHIPIHRILLDPLFWQALGKAEGWELFISRYPIQIEAGNTDRIPQWQFYWLKFIDHIAEGKSVDSFFDNLLVKN